MAKTTSTDVEEFEDDAVGRIRCQPVGERLRRDDLDVEGGLVT